MIAEFSIVPIGEGTSVSKHVALALDLVDKSGMPYKLGPMGTTVEGTWDEVMGLIHRCHEAVMGEAGRAIITIRVDDRKGVRGMLEAKVSKVEERLGHALSK